MNRLDCHHGVLAGSRELDDDPDGVNRNPFLAVALFMSRELINDMDIPTRQSYSMAIVPADARTTTAGVTNLGRTLAQAVTPAAAGWVGETTALGVPIVIGSVIKLVYNAALYAMFRTVRAPTIRDVNFRVHGAPTPTGRASSWSQTMPSARNRGVVHRIEQQLVRPPSLCPKVRPESEEYDLSQSEWDRGQCCQTGYPVCAYEPSAEQSVFRGIARDHRPLYDLVRWTVHEERRRGLGHSKPDRVTRVYGNAQQASGRVELRVRQCSKWVGSRQVQLTDEKPRGIIPGDDSAAALSELPQSVHTAVSSPPENLGE